MKNKQMRGSITHLRLESRFGRTIVIGQLEDERGHTQFMGTIAEILVTVQENDIEITNAQEVLEFLVCQNGFAA